MHGKAALKSTKRRKRTNAKAGDREISHGERDCSSGTRLQLGEGEGEPDREWQGFDLFVDVLADREIRSGSLCAGKVVLDVRCLPSGCPMDAVGCLDSGDDVVGLDGGALGHARDEQRNNKGDVLWGAGRARYIGLPDGVEGEQDWRMVGGYGPRIGSSDEHGFR